MGAFNSKSIRNVAVIGHSGEGKTTLCEAMLYNAKAIDRMGKVPEGNTVMDYESEEIARNISISMSVANLVWKDVKINLLDVPGFYDFEGEMISAMSAADCAIIVMSAGGYISVGAEKAINYCLINKVPAMIFINGIDKENANYLNTLKALQDMYPNKIAPLQIPILDGTKMTGYISVMGGHAYDFSEKGRERIDIPANYADELKELKAKLTETAAENDEALLDKFFGGEQLSYDELVLGVKKGIAMGSSIPVLSGSAYTDKGIINLLDQVVELMPASDVKGTVKALNEKNEEVIVKCDENAPFSAFIFKTIADPFVGKLNIFKVISGKIKSGVTVHNTNKGTDERINSIMISKGKKQENVDELYAGDIGAFAKLVSTSTGDTLCDSSNKIKFPQLNFPAPVISMCISSQKVGDEDKVFSGLNKLLEEDVTFTLTKNTETHETLINGLGETQLEVICKKLKNKFNVDAALKAPKIAYRETIKKIVNAEGKHKKQSGGHGQYGHCKVRFEPCYDQEFVFADEVVGGSVPKQYIPAVEKGLKENLSKGVLAGYKVVNLKAVLYDGSYHDVDSSEESFKLAAGICFREGIKTAEPALMEPIYTLKIKVPESFIGDIMGDLNKRRGRILGMEGLDGYQIITAEAPLAEVQRYATDLRSLTQGRGMFNMELSRYEEAPANVSQKIIADNKTA